MTQDFGVIICCCRFDFFLAKGCVASVRRALGNDVPITLFMDDDVDAAALAKEYNLNLLFRKDIKDDFLRENNRGWGRTKISLFWVSPYETFLYLDCDTIMWGDVVSKHLHGEWDMVIDPGDLATRPWVEGVGTDWWVNKDYFDTRLLEQHHPDFPWRKYGPSCFCTGCYAARRGIFPLDEYKAILAEVKSTPKLFLSAEMGFLNFMIFRAMEQGRLNVQQRPIQMLCESVNKEWLPERYPIGPDGPIVKSDDQLILHFTDPKPISVSYGFHKPFDYFRIEANRRLSFVARFMPRLYLWFEQLEWRITKWWRSTSLKRYHRFVRPMLFWKRARA